MIKETIMDIKETIRGHVVEYYDLEHKYFVDGIEVISVSTICKKENPGMYTGISQQTLNNAAKRGTHLHKEIENYEKHQVPGFSVEFKNYLKVKERLGFKKELTETMVLLEIENQVVSCGRFDILALMNDELCLIDIKRTKDIHMDYFKLQLNLYRYGYKQSYDIDISKLMVIRLRDNEINIIDVPIDDILVENTLKKYIKKINTKKNLEVKNPVTIPVYEKKESKKFDFDFTSIYEMIIAIIVIILLFLWIFQIG